MGNVQDMIENWTQQIYDLLDAGAELGEIEQQAQSTIDCIREERDIDD